MHWNNMKIMLSQNLPLLNWLMSYSKQDVIPDIVAGITVGLMLIPQSIAYATLSELNPQYGLYSAIAGGLVYAVFGNVKQITIGPTAVLALLTCQYAHEGNPQVVALLTFITGICELLFGFLQLGFIIDFVSMPVISGYTSAATLVIISSQIKGLLGLKFKSDNFLSTVEQLVSNIKKTRFADAVLGLTCLVILITIRQLKDVKTFKGSLVFFYVSAGKNALVVILSTALAYGLNGNGQKPFVLTGNITGGLPSFTFPNFSPEFEGSVHTFPRLLQQLGLGITTITCIAIISIIVVAKIFTRGEKLDASQEIVALGAANLLGSFIGSMPVSGSFSRSAVNNSCGVKTPISGFYTALLVILALVILTPYFYFIPKATLSAVVMSAVLCMVEYDLIIPMWKTNRKDLIPLCGTFFSALLLGIEIGLVCGLLIDLAFLLYHNARPAISVEKLERNQEIYWVITPRNGLLYPAASYIREKIIVETNVSRKEQTNKYILNLVHVSRLDYTSTQVLKNIVNEVTSNNKEIIIVNSRKVISQLLQEVIPNVKTYQSLDFLPEVQRV